MGLLSDKEAKVISDRIDRARRFTEREVHPNLRRASELYKGAHWPNMQVRSETPRIVFNILYPAVETKVSNLSFSYPDFVLKPLNREGADHAEIAKHVIAYDWRQAGAQEEQRRALRDREIHGIGVGYVFWLFETEPIGGQPGRCVEGGRPAEAMETGDTTPDPFLPPPLEEPVLAVRTDRPAVKRLSPFCFWVSPEADAVLANAEFCGFSELRPVDEVKRDSRYSNTRKLVGKAKGLKPWMDPEEREKDDAEMPADVRRVTLYHYFEKSRKLHCVYCDEHQKPLLVEPWRWEGDWYPFVIQRASDDEDTFWPLPPLLRVEHQQQEINEARTQHSQWRRQAVPKFQTRVQLDNKQRGSVRCGRAGEVVENVAEPITVLPTPPLQQEVLEAGQMALSDLQFALGLNSYETATPPSKRLTSSEVEAMRLSGGSRAVADRQAFEMACSELARRFLALEKQYSVRSRELPIFGRDENVAEFRDYTREEIAGEYLVEVAVGSTTAPKNDAILEQVGFLMQSIPGFVQAMQAAQMVGLDLRAVLPRLLRAALPDLRDIEQELLSQLAQPMMPPQPMMAEGQEMDAPEMEAPEMGVNMGAQEQLAAMLAGGGAF